MELLPLVLTLQWKLKGYANRGGRLGHLQLVAAIEYEATPAVGLLPHISSVHLPLWQNLGLVLGHWFFLTHSTGTRTEPR